MRKNRALTGLLLAGSAFLLVMGAGCGKKTAETTAAETTAAETTAAETEAVTEAQETAESETEKAETKAAAAETGTEEGTEQADSAKLPPYVYCGSDLIESAVCDFVLTETKEYFDVEDGKVMIPAPVIVRIDDADPEDVKVYGNFWHFVYHLEDRNLVCDAGGEMPGLLHLKQVGDGYMPVSFDRVGDGAQYAEDIHRIADGDDALEKALNAAGDGGSEQVVGERERYILDYADGFKLDIESYQDFGWDKVMLR